MQFQIFHLPILQLETRVLKHKENNNSTRCGIWVRNFVSIPMGRTRIKK
jgi:hypothetical protein